MESAKEFILPSGAKVYMSVAPFQDAQALTKALMKSIKGVPLSDDVMSMDVSVLKDALIEAATSDDVQSAIFRCMERATYDGIKITRDLFDDKDIGLKARQDFYGICAKIIEFNCMPFFDQALSMLKTSLKKNTNIQKQG
jgi:Phage tail assembly chaperone protein, TAC